jgi:GNAT superfamily N-acetyltransferase
VSTVAVDGGGVTLVAMSSANEAARVRRLNDADRDRWEVLWAGYLAFYRADIPLDVTALTFERLRDGRDGLSGLVAVDVDDQAIGLAHLVVHASTWSDAGYCYLEDLYVDPSHRGGGVARALIEAVYAEAAARGLQRVYWHTQQYNAPARSLYDTVGTPTSFIVYEHVDG